MISTKVMLLLCDIVVLGLLSCFFWFFMSIRRQDLRRTDNFLRRVTRHPEAELEQVVGWFQGRSRVTRHPEAELERANYPDIVDDELVKNDAKTIIAFPADYLLARDIGNIRTTRLQINGVNCVGVPISYLSEICEMAGISPARLTTVETNYDDIYLAQVSPNDAIRIKTSEKEDSTSVLKRKYTEIWICGYNRKKAMADVLKRTEIKLQSKIEYCQQQLVTSLRELEETQKQLQAVQSIDESSLSRSGDEFDHLINHPDVEKVDIVDDKLLVRTAPISINYQNIEYDIGRFCITVHVNGAKGGVTMTNLTRTVSRDGGEPCYDHPHINRGIPCFGNIKEVIPHLIAERKYPALVSVCIQYLKSYNKSDSASPHINNWPRKRK